MAKQKAPIKKKRVSFAVIQIFSLKALKMFLQNLLLSHFNKSFLLLLLAPPTWKVDVSTRVQTEWCSTSQHRPNASKFFLWWWMGGMHILNTESSKYFDYFSVRIKVITYILILELFPSHHPFPTVSSFLILRLFLVCCPKTQGWMETVFTPRLQSVLSYNAL